MKEMFQYLLFGQLFIAGVGSACVSDKCLRCNITGATPADFCPSCQDTCINDTVYANMSADCKKAFQVSINSSGSSVNEGDDITLTCVHDLPSLALTFGWKKKQEIQENENKSELFLKGVRPSMSSQYICFLNSSCGYYESLPHGVTVKNNSVILLVICGISSLALVLLMGLALKFKMKRDNAKQRERVEHRIQAGKIRDPAPIVPRAS
ncbi:Hypothetical protein SMAX5B_008815 [Scophthalmus maximus]|uniref:Ig-like domain-containing protein n=1 Tax=Scophthalmus maximus TaxID=52904 RepID=A0A2U9C6G7_SCOMX|nr:uncharacterized protein LOC118319595 isoform X2 [Scophthalmus maximus]AWP12152.1 Hypothetical protein SMAX5B_008815 [Scophthalmus maximus]AWP12153.1 Hypothetical protein SMAX5B_008815 [Scophthalmus maximus]AWP12154.1 Hypothetical protein SMAX5B_008815 [Scophthalmus maximus]AWP12155.1 Hypothetical protein SMAX5B_008815 [Scophthalmus maximus]AWP12156.1 Hypothetical protein SMAX5B_008815 [Scophthalmus maximus]